MYNRKTQESPLFAARGASKLPQPSKRKVLGNIDTPSHIKSQISSSAVRSSPVRQSLYNTDAIKPKRINNIPSQNSSVSILPVKKEPKVQKLTPIEKSTYVKRPAIPGVKMTKDPHGLGRRLTEAKQTSRMGAASPNKSASLGPNQRSQESSSTEKLLNVKGAQPKVSLPFSATGTRPQV